MLIDLIDPNLRILHQESLSLSLFSVSFEVDWSMALPVLSGVLPGLVGPCGPHSWASEIKTSYIGEGPQATNQAPISAMSRSLWDCMWGTHGAVFEDLRPGLVLLAINEVPLVLGWAWRNWSSAEIHRQKGVIIGYGILCVERPTNLPYKVL